MSEDVAAAGAGAAVDQGADQGAAAGAGEAAGASAGGWLDGLPEDLRGQESLKDFKSPEDLARSYVNTKSLVGRKRALPADDAPQEQWESYYTDIGRPEAPDKYELTPPQDFPEQYYSKELEQGYRALAHQAGLTPKQAKLIYDGYMKQNQDAIGQILGVEREAKSKAEVGLRAEWGDQYDSKKADADYVIQAVGGQDPYVAESLAKKDPVWNHPALARFLAAVGASMRESDLVKGGTANQKQTLEQERMKLMSSEAYFDKKHSEYAATKARVKEIYGIMHPDQAEEED